MSDSITSQSSFFFRLCKDFCVRKMHTLTSFPSDLEESSFAASFSGGGQVLRLRLDSAGFKSYRHDTASRMVTFIGKTHTGKSNLGKDLLPRGGYDAPAGLPAPSAGGFASLEPTTGDCRFFQATCEAKDKVLTVLDMEEERAGDELPSEVREKLKPGTSLERYCIARRDAAREHLPRLAYAVSDVLVYVTTGSLSQNDVVRDCAQLHRGRDDGPAAFAGRGSEQAAGFRRGAVEDPQNTLLLRSWVCKHC